MNEIVKVSIIIPIYNMQDYVSDCITSVIYQSLNEIEIICVDDGSIDDSSKIIKQYCEKEPRLKYIYQDNQGAGVARNTGISMAKGKYVMFLDPDDRYASNDVVEALFNECERHHVMIAGGYHVEVVDDSDTHEINIYPELTNNAADEDKGKMISFFQFVGEYYHWDYIFNRSFLIDNDIKYPDYRRNQDTPFLVMALWKADVFYYLPKIIIRYRRSRPNKDVLVDKYYSDVLKGYRDVLIIAKKSSNEVLFKNILNIINYSSKSSIIRHLNEDVLEVLLDIYRINNDSKQFSTEVTIIHDLCEFAREGSKIIHSANYEVGVSLKNRISEFYRTGGSFKLFLKQINAKNVIIYGMGNRGMCLYDLLIREGVNVCGGMDIHVRQIGTLSVLRPGSDISQFGPYTVIIISLREYEDIYNMLKHYYSVPVFSFEEVLITNLT